MVCPVRSSGSSRGLLPPVYVRFHGEAQTLAEQLETPAVRESLGERRDRIVLQEQSVA